MEETEYKGGEKVLYKTRVKLSLPHKEPEEAECFVTEGHVVIDATEPIKIPVLRVRGSHIATPSLSPSYSALSQEPDSTTVMTLTFLDELKKKRNLSLQMASMVASSFNSELTAAIREAKEKWIESLPIEKNWFARHLNWTLFLSWIFALGVNVAFGDYTYVDLFLGSLSVSVSPIIDSGAVGGWVVLIGGLVIILLVTGWVLRVKNRSLLNLLWYLFFPPIGAIIILFLGKEPKIA